MKSRHLFIIGVLVFILLGGIVWNASVWSVQIEGARSRRREEAASTAKLDRKNEKRKEKKVRYANEDSGGNISEIKDIIGPNTLYIAKQKDDKLARDLAKIKEQEEQAKQTEPPKTQ